LEVVVLTDQRVPPTFLFSFTYLVVITSP